VLPESDLFSLAEVAGTLRVPGLGEAVHFSTLTPGLLSGGERGRLNIENRCLMGAVGLLPGVQVRPEFGPDFLFVRRVDQAGPGTIQIAPKSYANRDGSVTLGGRIDIRRIQVAEVFGDESRLIVCYFASGLLITLLPTRAKARARWRSLLAAVAKGKLTTGSAYSGIGTLDLAAHAGLEEAGFQVESLFAGDIWHGAVEAMLQDNPARPRTAAALPIEEFVALDRGAAPSPDILIMGVPCKGASKLNIRDRQAPELHPVAGHQVLNVALLLQSLKFSPSILLIENVVDWSDSVSYSMLKRVLEEQGYATLLVGDRNPDGKYLGLDGSKFGDMERRKRMALLAVPPELAALLDFSQMREATSTRTVGSIRQPEAAIDPRDYEKGRGLAAKAARGFRNKIVADDATTSPVLSATCHKIRPEDPKFRHPTDPAKFRLPVPEEHARLKGQPEALIRALPFSTHAHIALGNGSTRKVWQELFRVLGLTLRQATA
jgi:DNA (cytosine-5)-methyltransferase 1